MRLRTLLGSATALTLLSGCSFLAPTPEVTTETPVSSATEAAGLTCTVSSDGTHFTVTGTNTSSSTRNYVGDVSVTKDGQEVSSVTIREYAIAPGEALASTTFTGSHDVVADGCSADAVEVTEEVPAMVGATDVSDCGEVTESTTNKGLPSYKLTVTNSSTKVAAEYTIRVAIRNSAGERVSTRLFLVVWDLGNWTALKPGATSTRSDDVLGVPYEAGMSCQVVSVAKQTSDDFFTSKDGVQQGSIDADIAFDSGSAALTADAKVLLQSALEPLRSTPGPVCVTGYADSVGDKDANLTLSSERAKSVADYLKSSGVTAQIQTQGKGESEAKKDNQADAKLRRVDIAMQACS